MDVTPQSLKDVEFRQALRGYDPDEVDLFLQRVSAGVAQLQGRLSEAISRAEAAEKRIDRGDTAAPKQRARTADQPSEQTITRTLLLAQQTADRLLAEARDEASTTLSSVQNEAAEVRGEAQAEADELRRAAKLETDELRSTAITETETLRSVTDSETSKLRRTTQSEVDALLLEAEHASSKAAVEAEAERSAILSEVESEARAVAEATRTPLLAEIRQLEDRRDFLAEDVALLEHHVDAERTNVLASMARLQAVIDEPEALRVSTIPELSRYSKLEAHPQESLASPPAPTETSEPVEVLNAEVEAVEVPAEEPAVVLSDDDAIDISEAPVSEVSNGDNVILDVVEADAEADDFDVSDVEVAAIVPDDELDLTDPETPSLADPESGPTDQTPKVDARESVQAGEPGGTDSSGPGAKTLAAGGVAAVGAGSFIDSFGASPTSVGEPKTDPSATATAADSVQIETHEISAANEDVSIESHQADAAPEVAAIDAAAVESSDVMTETSGEVLDFERTPIADDLGFVDPVEAPTGIVDPNEAEDALLPVFDDDDFFGTTADEEELSEFNDTTSEDTTTEHSEDMVIDLTSEPNTGSSFASGGSFDEPTQAFSMSNESESSMLNDSESKDARTETSDSVAPTEAPRATGESGEDEATGDAFLEELRRAVSDDENSDDDPALVAFFDDDSDGPTKRFGRQR